MLTGADEFPFHQTPDPMAFAGTDRNFYDRYFFNGYTRDRSLFFAMAFGLYPNLDVMDGAFCVLKDGKQHILRASRRMNGDRSVLSVGPLSIEIIEPLKSCRLLVSDNESGLKADLTFDVRHPPIEEPRFTRRMGTRAFMDYTRLTQNVTWRGWIEVAGTRHAVQSATCWGTRDRSWGIRPVGAPDAQPPPSTGLPQFYWLWTPTNIDGHVDFGRTNDDERGRPWTRRAVEEPVDGGRARHYHSLSYEYHWQAGSRRLAGLTCRMEGEAGPATLSLTMGPRFYMSGLGYTHPVWGHGMDHGDLEVAHEVLDTEQLEDTDILFMHIQALTTARLETDGRSFEGLGVAEQLFLGRHDEAGLGDLLSPWQAPA